MAYSRAFSGWRYRYKYGSRSSRRWRSGNRRRATGNAIAARHQRDAATVTINRIGTFTVNVPINSASGSTSYSLWNELRNSEFYSNYAPMYDQVKMDKVRLKITGFRAGSAQTDNISPSVVLAFDRNGLDPTQTVTANLISTYSSAQLKQWSNGNSFTMYQTIYPSTIMEKGQYIPTGSLADPTTVPASSNPCSPVTDPTLPFKPITLIGVDLGAAAAAAQTFAFNVEFEYTVTFRGMRKPSLSSSSVLVPLEVEIDSNDTYIYEPQDYDADGFSSVTITTNVPSSSTDIKLDRVTFYQSSGSSTYDIVGPSILFSSLILTTAITRPTIPAGGFLLRVFQTSAIFGGTVYQLDLYRYRSGGNDVTVTIPANYYYAVFAPDDILPTVYATLASGSDSINLLGTFPRTADFSAMQLVQADDLSFVN